MPDDAGPGDTAFPDDRGRPTPIPRRTNPAGPALAPVPSEVAVSRGPGPAGSLAPAGAGAPAGSPGTTPPGAALSGEPRPPVNPPAGLDDQVRRTRTSSTYVGIGVGLLVLIVILVFVVQNLHQASVHFITLRFRLPQGVIVLASAVAGGLLVLLVSLARVVQLRRAARRTRRAARR